MDGWVEEYVIWLHKFGGGGEGGECKIFDSSCHGGTAYAAYSLPSCIH
jgi:hypothetical protein